MKKFSILFASVAMLFGVGLGVGALSGDSEAAAPVEKVEAATPSSFTKVYRFTVPHDFGSDVGNHIYLHAWGSDGGDTTWGSFITLSDYSYNENSERMYTYATDYVYTGFIIIRYADNPDYCKTQDITVGSDTAWSWNGNNGAAANAWTPENQTYYLYDYKNMFGGEAKCYAWQSNGSLNNGDYPGVAMTKVQYGSGQLYSISLDPAFDEVIFGIGTSANTGDQWCNQHRGETFCWWDAGDGDWSNDLDWVKAHDWVYQTMHVRDISPEVTSDTGACKGENGYYAKAKAAYQSFSAEIKAKIDEDSCKDIAMARLAAWAAANGESFDSVNGSFSSSGNYFTVTDSNSTLLIVIIISAVSVASLAALLIIKKRKHN